MDFIRLWKVAYDECFTVIVKGYLWLGIKFY